MWTFKLTRVFIDRERCARCIVPLIAGSVMALVAFLPWLQDPLGEVYSAWRIPVNLGWPFHSGFFNYGVLCLGCACYSFYSARMSWKQNIPFNHVMLALVCLTPTGLFLLQYLYFDLQAIAALAHHKDQMLLVQNQFGYRVGHEIFLFKAFGVDITNVWGRFRLLVDQLQVGAIVPLLAVCVLLDLRRFTPSSAEKKYSKKSRWLIGVLLFLFFVTLARAIGGEICENEASNAIALGNYGSALQWLDGASFFNPSYNDALFYHVKRGQALYLMHPDQQSDDSRAYTISLLVQQRYNLDAYRQLFILYKANKAAPWILEQMSNVLEHLANSAKPGLIKYLPQVSQTVTINDDAALPYLQLLIQVEPDNVYGQYMLGRVDYDLQNYASSEARFKTTLQLSSNTDLQSSIFTYLALNEERSGNSANERALLLKAVQFDPNFHNNTARDELSGLR